MRSVNLTKMTVLIAESNSFQRNILRQTLRSFGADTVVETETVQQCSRYLSNGAADVLICDAELEGGSAFSLIREVRMDKNHSKRSIPMIMTMSVSRRLPIHAARDVGANMVILKPFSPIAVYDRLAWIAHTPRDYWESDTFYGPDRRVRIDAEGEKQARRSNDLTQDDADEAFAMEKQDDAA